MKALLEYNVNTKCGEGMFQRYVNVLVFILFKQVDVVFEEDKGFWAAIQTFISTTKRPIILTTSDGSVAEIVDGRHEMTTLKHPSAVSLKMYSCICQC